MKNLPKAFDTGAALWPGMVTVYIWIEDQGRWQAARQSTTMRGAVRMACNIEDGRFAYKILIRTAK